MKSCEKDNNKMYYCILDDNIKVEISQTGGYYEKYLKYKNKYLELKRNS